MMPIRLRSMGDIPFDDSCVVLCDSTLPDTLIRALPHPIPVAGGEGLKTLASIESLAEQVLRRRSSRPMTLVAVGGGSVGDAVGFLASILWRGVDLWHVPTTLLAMVDSAHGGKTALNLGGHKNQIGTFHPAARTYIIEQALETLPLRARADGMAELVKVLMLGATDRLDSIAAGGGLGALLAAPFHEIREELGGLIDTAIGVKLGVVEADPRETQGLRIVLNLGHTLAHALELLQGLSHGQAVAWGLAAAIDLSTRFGLDSATSARWLRLLHPLLRPLTTPVAEEPLLRAIGRDKKHARGRLHSVVLEAPGRPLVTTEPTAHDWIAALHRCQAWHAGTPVRVVLRTPRPSAPRPGAGKSELNRALIIAALLPVSTTITGRSDADDVRRLTAALRALGRRVDDTPDGFHVTPMDPAHAAAELHAPLTLHAGAGGTTLRFLLALAALRPGVTRIIADPQLLRRPHEPLIAALRRGGAHIDRIDTGDGPGWEVRGWESVPRSMDIDVAGSSQYASALAMLALAADGPMTLRLVGEAVSEGYLDMTLSMLASVGVEVLRSRDVIALNPPTGITEPVRFIIPPDASALAIWRIASRLGLPVDPGPVDASAGHPDAAVLQIMDAIDAADRNNGCDIDLSNAPDLAPLLVAYALRAAVPVRFTRIAHLRHKESNRLDDLASALRGIGITVETGSDWLRLPPQAAGGVPATRVVVTHADHRMVFAAVLLSLLLGPLSITDPWCVTKSCPEFWDHVREAGWEVEPDTEGG